MRIGVLTSGGDAPGMNAAIRTLVLAGHARGHEILGILRGYDGLLGGQARPLGIGETDGISRLGGTILGSARSKVFPTPAGQARAREQLAALRLDALVVIGGNGSLTGAHALADGHASAIVGLPASIDHDIGHTGLSIGVDTALNTIVEACDRISDTARAHHRAFVVEVMGRKSGFLAMRAGLAAEADAILYGESNLDEETIVAQLRQVMRHAFSPARDKQRVLIIKSEGVEIPTQRLVDRLQAHLEEDAPGVDIRATVLGHVVRGGSPTALERVVAQRLGFGAILALDEGAHDVMLAWDPPALPDRSLPGAATADSSVRRVPLADVLAETARLLDGSSPIVRRRVAMLRQVEGLLAL